MSINLLTNQSESINIALKFSGYKVIILYKRKISAFAKKTIQQHYTLEMEIIILHIANTNCFYTKIKESGGHVTSEKQKD